MQSLSRRLPSPSGSRPTAFFDLRSGTIPTSSTFTRGSSGWYFNSSGVLTSASSNVARFDYDPVTLQPLGYLAEMQSTNAIAQSQALTVSPWTATGLTVTDNVQASPDGTTNASTIKVDTSTGGHRNGYVSTPIVNGSVYGVSFFVKNIVGSSWVQFGTSPDFFNFNPSTGTIGSNSALFSNINARQLANGWWRVSGFYNSGTTGNTVFGVALVPASNSTFNPSYTGDGTSTVAVWGVQFETAGVGVTSHIPTAGSTVTRSQDILSLPLTSLPGWSPNRGGVLVATYRLHTLNPSSPGNNQPAAYLSDGSFNNGVRLLGQANGNGTFGADYFSGGVQQTETASGASAVFARRKLAAGWQANRLYVAYDGQSMGANTSTQPLPVAPTTLDFGRSSSAGLNGTFESIAYYAGARPDAFVQAVSR
jgi:hypothetical protein